MVSNTSHVNHIIVFL